MVWRRSGDVSKNNAIPFGGHAFLKLQSSTSTNEMKRLFRLPILCGTAILMALSTASCDDSTGTLGVDMMPTTDFVEKQYASYDVAANSYAVGDSVLARSSVSYLGRYTDPETNTIVKSDFLAQFHCSEAFSFPDSVNNDSVTSVEIRLFVEDFVGDSLATFKLSVYPLNAVMDPDQNYYTNIDPTRYYDASAEPITTKWFTLADHTLTDEDRASSSYSNNIRIALPREVGQQIYDAYRANPEYFANTDAFLHSGLPCSKGMYFKIESGDGAMAYIDVSQFNIYFRYYDSEYSRDTTGVCQFASTEEVVQATRFENSRLNLLTDNQHAAYLKSPAGIFTLAELPTDQIELNDTINSATLTFTRYNDKTEGNFKLAIPQTVLLVRLDDYLNGFFENYDLADGYTSYVTTFDESSNTYTFSNIAHLLTTIKQEKAAGTATANADKVLVIPVQATYDSSSSLVRLNHDFSLQSAKLVGGVDDRAKLEVIYSRYK